MANQNPNLTNHGNLKLSNLGSSNCGYRFPPLSCILGQSKERTFKSSVHVLGYVRQTYEVFSKNPEDISKIFRVNPRIDYVVKVPHDFQIFHTFSNRKILCPDQCRQANHIFFLLTMIRFIFRVMHVWYICLTYHS